MTARAQAFFNSRIHPLRDATGVGTLETGWDGERKCWRKRPGRGAAAGRCLIEMQFVTGQWTCIVRRLQPCLGLAGSTLCIRIHTTYTQRARRAGSPPHPFPLSLEEELDGKPAVSQARLGNRLALNLPQAGMPKKEKQHEPFWMGGGKQDAISVLKSVLEKKNN